MQAPKMVGEYRRWRDAPVDQKDRVTRQQFLSGIGQQLAIELLPGLRNPGEAIMPNGKTGQACSADDFAEMATWLRALARASREALRALEIRRTFAGCSL
jgi:hypothetical protein